MEKYTSNVVDRAGNAVPGASVRIFNANGTDAALFASNGGASIGNPIVTDENGMYSFAAANGHYTMKVSYAGVLYATIDGIVLFDPADGGTGPESAALDALAANNGSTLVSGAWFGGAIAPLSNLALTQGAAMIGHGSGSIAQKLDALTAFDAQLGASGGAALIGATGWDSVAAALTAMHYASGKAALDELATSNGTTYVWGAWFDDLIASASDLALPHGATMIGHRTGSIAQALDTNAVDIAANATAITANTASINTNTTNISSNTTAINANTTAIDSIVHPAAAITPATLGELRFEKTSNTQLTLRLKGSDGIVRSVALTLA